ncbi:MAG: hypothetical protein JKX70_12200 [Phycisphaerales bacterium]|nr:hypothetical protein [Phycisphaerales bacterium]
MSSYIVGVLTGLLIGLTLIPALTKDYPSEMVFVNVHNKSQSKCWVLIEDTKGQNQGQIIDIQQLTSIQIFAGEFYEDRFPERVQITVLSSDYLVLDTRSFNTSIKTSDGESAQIIDLKITQDESGQLAVVYLESSSNSEATP